MIPSFPERLRKLDSGTLPTDLRWTKITIRRFANLVQALTNHAQLLKIAKKANMFLRTDREFRNSQFTNIGPFPIMKCSKDNLSDQAIFVHWLERSLFGENITIATQVKSSQEEPQIRMPAIVLSIHCLQRVMPLLTIRTGTKTPRARSQILAFP